MTFTAPLNNVVGYHCSRYAALLPCGNYVKERSLPTGSAANGDLAFVRNRLKQADAPAKANSSLVSVDNESSALEQKCMCE